MRLRAVYILVLSLIPLAAQFSMDSRLRSQKANIPKKCTYLKNHGMMAADCYGLELAAVPQNLRTDIELLHATRNRIRELTRDTFSRYSFLKYIYLDDNLILTIDNGTFDTLYDLEVLCLSRNGIRVFPSDILLLPKIRKIFLDYNHLIPGGVFAGAPASDTLEYLNLAYCNLKELPPLVGYPSLLELNVSGNNLKRLSPQQLAPMCQLHWLDLTGNPELSDGNNFYGCDCHLLGSWIADRNIILQSGYKLQCRPERHDFTHCGNMTEEMEIHGACMSAVAARAEIVRGRKIWIIVLAVLAGSLVVLCLILALVHRRNRRKNQKKKKKTATATTNNNDGSGPLTSQEQEVQSGELLSELQETEHTVT